MKHKPNQVYKLKGTNHKFIVRSMTVQYDMDESNITFILTNVETGLDSEIEELILSTAFEEVERF